MAPSTLLLFLLQVTTFVGLPRRRLDNPHSLAPYPNPSILGLFQFLNVMVKLSGEKSARAQIERAGKQLDHKKPRKSFIIDNGIITE